MNIEILKTKVQNEDYSLTLEDILVIVESDYGILIQPSSFVYLACQNTTAYLAANKDKKAKTLAFLDGQFKVSGSSNGDNPTGDLLESLFAVSVSRWSSTRGKSEEEKTKLDGQNILFKFPVGSEQANNLKTSIAEWIAENGYTLCSVGTHNIKSDSSDMFGTDYTRVYIEKKL
jgi:hypothetical protein